MARKKKDGEEEVVLPIFDETDAPDLVSQEEPHKEQPKKSKTASYKVALVAPAYIMIEVNNNLVWVAGIFDVKIGDTIQLPLL